MIGRFRNEGGAPCSRVLVVEGVLSAAVLLPDGIQGLLKGEDGHAPSLCTLLFESTNPLQVFRGSFLPLLDQSQRLADALPAGHVVQFVKHQAGHLILSAMGDVGRVETVPGNPHQPTILNQVPSSQRKLINRHCPYPIRMPRSRT